MKLRQLFILSAIVVGFIIISCNGYNGTVIPVDIDEKYSSILIDSSSKALFLYDSKSNPNGKVRGYQGCSSIGYDKGIIYAAWISGVKDEEIGNYISVAASKDDGKSWDLDKLTIAPIQDSVRHFDPSFWSDRYGVLRMNWTTSTGMWDGGIGGTWSIRMKYELNEIKISSPQKMFNGVMNVKPIHLGVDSSSILFPVSGWNITEGIYNGEFFKQTLPQYNGVFLYKSVYRNTPKLLLAPTKFVKIPTSQPRVHDEAMVLDLGMNTLKCFFRTQKGIFTSVSTDGGLNWSSQIAFKDLGPTAVSRFYVGRLKSGNILLVMNASTEREMLTAFLSKDNGETWPYKLLIDRRKGASYPDIIQKENGVICMIHDYKRYPNGEIKFTQFTESDIISGDVSKVVSTTISSLR
ncbi:sialidase family protein [Flectobacillus rivi]|uniref:Sialidase family protein n=1 Tax=Flectobacillus rivi TaxID=2984209 RepID=A0ABT6YY73_9BACT|nr:sialidase family protein [Flectobacillus rivi]MDI9873354.1 sialidase family protein [Flectobacillus rivi]